MPEAFKFPDEMDNDAGKTEEEIVIKNEGDEEIDVQIVDDTPKEDRNRKPLDPEAKEKLETLDESDEYSKNVKEKFSQYKKAWHEERRAKEQAFREQQEALNAAQAILDENKRLKQQLKFGEKELNSASREAARAEVEKAKQNYKEAYDSGDSDKLLAAQEKLTKAQIKLDKAKKVKNTVQNFQNDVQIPERQVVQQVQQAQPDPKLTQWVSRNQWFTNPAKWSMRKYAEGVHAEVVERYGQAVIGTDDYYAAIDNEVRRQFPEEFDDVAKNVETKPQRTKLSTVVAPAKRSTSSKQVVLTKSAQAIAKKLGLTPEQYAREFIKLES